MKIFTKLLLSASNWVTFSVRTNLLFHSVLISSWSFFSTSLISCSLRLIFLLQSLKNSSYFLNRTIWCYISSNCLRSLKNMFLRPSTEFFRRSKLQISIKYALLGDGWGQEFRHHSSEFGLHLIIPTVTLLRWIPDIRWGFSVINLKICTLFNSFLLKSLLLNQCPLFFSVLYLLYSLLVSGQSQIIFQLLDYFFTIIHELLLFKNEIIFN